MTEDGLTHSERPGNLGLMESVDEVVEASPAHRWPRAADRRGEARFATRYPGQLRLAGTEVSATLDCLVIDVSMSGARIRTF